jgi:hypothetical protein
VTFSRHAIRAGGDVPARNGDVLNFLDTLFAAAIALLLWTRARA